MLVRCKRDNTTKFEKVTRSKSVVRVDEEKMMLEEFVRPLYEALKEVSPKGIEPSLEYDAGACSFGIDARKLGKKVLDFLNQSSDIVEIGFVLRDRLDQDFNIKLTSSRLAPAVKKIRLKNLDTDACIKNVVEAYKMVLAVLEKESENESRTYRTSAFRKNIKERYGNSDKFDDIYKVARIATSGSDEIESFEMEEDNDSVQVEFKLRNGMVVTASCSKDDDELCVTDYYGDCIKSFIVDDSQPSNTARRVAMWFDQNADSLR